MSRVGSGLEAKALQVNGVPTPKPSDSIKRILNDAIGTLSEPALAEQAKIEPETTLQDVPNSAPQVQSETAGFTPEGELLPLRERAQNVQAGVQRPVWDEWTNRGTQPAQDFVPSRPLGADNGNATTPATPSPQNPLMDLLSRASRTAKMMDPMDTSQPTIRVEDTNVTQPDRKAAYTDINKRIDMELDPVEKDRLIKERADIANTENRQNTILGTYLNKLDAVKIDPQTGYATPDQKFLSTSAVATENALDGMFLGSDKNEEDVMNENGEVQRTSSDLINPSDAAERVAREAIKWWDAEKKAENKTINPNLSAQEAKDLGAMLLLSYAKANPDLVSIVNTKKDNAGNYVKDTDGHAIRFELTPLGSAIYDSNRGVREKALGIKHDPLIQPVPSLTNAAGIDRPAFRNENRLRGKGKDPSYATLDEDYEAIENLNSVAHVVDDRRSRIIAAMLVPTLFAPIGTKGDQFGESFGLGRVSLETTKKENMLLKGMDENAALEEAVRVMNSKKGEAAADIQTAIRFRGRPNYLTHAMQPLAGRKMVQQSDFNPTRKKIIRFVTRAKDPAVIRSRDSRLGKNYMNMMALSFGRDAKLERGRLHDLRDNRDKYYKWGEVLGSLLDEVLPMDAYRTAAEAIRRGQNIPPQMAQSLVKFQKGISGKAPDLMDFLINKGEEAPMAIDALIDFKNFEDAMEAGRPHTTFVNAYIDGKTNGIANQGMMLGNRNLAMRVGALRNEDSEYALNDNKDLRDEMADVIRERVLSGDIPALNNSTYQGDASKYKDIQTALEILGTDRSINKAISMIFPYGKEIPGMRSEIKKLIPGIRASNSFLDDLMTNLDMDDSIIDAAHDNVVYALFDIFGEDTFNTRGVMRGVGFMHAFADELFSLRGPSGHRILLGDKRVREDPVSQSKVAVTGPDGTKHVLKLQDSNTYMSSAAMTKGGEAAGYVRGRAAVIPTQSIDAATVDRVATGTSWNKMKELHPDKSPYLFQIYDAFKSDVHSFDVISYEANKAFLDITTRDWNFVEEALKEYRALNKSFRRNMEANPDAMYRMRNGKFDYLYRILNPELHSFEGQRMPTMKTMKRFVQSMDPINPELIYSESGPRPRKSGEDKQSPRDLLDAYDLYIHNRARVLQHKLYNTYNENAKSGGEKMNILTLDVGSPEMISAKQALAMFDVIEDEFDLMGRLSALVSKSNRNRAELRKEILDNYRKTGAWVAQFHAH